MKAECRVCGEIVQCREIADGSWVRLHRHYVKNERGEKLPLACEGSFDELPFADVKTVKTEL